MLADIGLWYGTSPSKPATQVKGLQVYSILPKLDASSWASKAYNPDEITRAGGLNGGGRTRDGVGMAL